MSAPTNVVFPSPRLNAGERLAVSGYTRGQVADYGNARAAERDEIHAAPEKPVVLEALRMARDALDHYLHGGSTFRKPAVSAIAAIDDALAALVQPPEAPAAVEVSRLAEDAKRLADELSMADGARNIPTGELYRGITNSQYTAKRQELHAAIDRIASRKAEPTDAPEEQPHAGSVAEAFWNGTLSDRNKS